MAYNNNIPLSTDLISNSQSQILGNFAAIDSGTTGTGIGFSRNHVTMTDGTNGGLHHRVDYSQSLSSPTISGFIGSLYPKNVSITTPSSTTAELFFKNGTADTQITSSTLAPSTGQGMLPGGLQFKTGFVTSGTHVSFSSVPFPTAILSIQLTSYATPTTFDVTGTPTASGFDFSPTVPGGAGVYWLAIGY